VKVIPAGPSGNGQISATAGAAVIGGPAAARPCEDAARQRRLKEVTVNIKSYTDVKATHFDSGGAKGVAARVVIGKDDGANNFCMRLFEISAGGNTAKHSHDWEHEMFIHAGAGEIYGNGQWNPVKAGNAVFIPSNEKHQIRNPGKESLLIVCLVPSKAPEL
jgi:quercetin dioxygenase-like cupin family protein